VGECFLYRGYGICRVSDVSSHNFGDGVIDYYELRSVYDQSSVAYVPVSSPLVGQMRHVLSGCEINAVIDGAPGSGNCWIDDGKLRAVTFSRLIDGGDRRDILWVVITLCDYRTQLASQRKKLYAMDEKLLSTALRMIKEEFAFVLGIDREEVVAYISNRLGHGLSALPSA
jgi:Transcriptional regulators, similar to M. xanthus CarD